jgi:SAM-dependent methyltransferase
VLDLGDLPLSDGFLTEDELKDVEPRFPLEVAFCPGCTLVQILETVPPTTLFCNDYPYFSSFSDALLAHSRDNALELIDRHGLGSDSLVVELASNDGYMLRNFVDRGIPVLGIDPAEGPAAAAEAIGVPTLAKFFGRDLAEQLRDDRGQADVIIANNVLAHVADTNGFIEGIKILLKPDGEAAIEFPYVRALVDRCEFDTIYHEHLCYFSVHAVDALFRRHGLFVNEIRQLPIHGGSLRLYVRHRESVQDSVRSLLKDEVESGLTRHDYYLDFSSRVDHIRGEMRTLLKELRAQGKEIAAYGAAAKGTIMLNAIGANSDIIEFVADRNVHKQGKWVPGARIPIVAPEELVRRRPDLAVLLAWNFKDEILKQQAEYRALGGRFIVPIPKPEIV